MRLSASCLVALAVVCFAQAARAEEEKKEEKKEEAAETRGLADIEVLVGAGQIEALNPTPSSTTSGQLRYERSLTDVIASGVVLSGRYELVKEVSVGFRLPVAIATLMPEEGGSRGTVNLGNVTLQLEWEKELSEHVGVFLGVHLALPTASGSELPSEEELAGDQSGIDPVSADKFAVNRAVASAFGFANNAMWLAGYIGVVPAAGMNFRFGPVHIEPYVEAENMFSVRKNARESVIVEFDAGGRISVTVASFPSDKKEKTHFDVGARAWGSFTLTDHEGDLNVGIVEPELRIGGKRWRVTAGLLVPFAGELRDEGWISGRLSATVAF